MFVCRLLDYDIVKDICRIINENQTISMQIIEPYLHLLGNIANDNISARNKTISSGAVPIIKKLLEQAVQEN
jgi:hypothetical protein